MISPRHIVMLPHALPALLPRRTSRALQAFAPDKEGDWQRVLSPARSALEKDLVLASLLEQPLQAPHAADAQPAEQVNTSVCAFRLSRQDEVHLPFLDLQARRSDAPGNLRCCVTSLQNRVCAAGAALSALDRMLSNLYRRT